MRFTGNSRWFFGVLALLGVACTYAGDEKPSVQSFFKYSTIINVSVSPDNQHLAVIERGGAANRYMAVVLDMATLANPRVVAGFNNVDVTNIEWVNNHRLYFLVNDALAPDGKFSGDEYAVEADGSELVQLTTANGAYAQERTGSNIKTKLLPTEYYFFSSLNDGSDDIIVARNEYNNVDHWRDSVRLYRMNTVNRKLTDAVEGVQPAKVTEWLLDTQGRPVVAESYYHGRHVVSYRAPGTEKWEELANVDYSTDKGLSPEFFDFDGKLYVTAATSEGNSALYQYDLKAHKLASEPMLSLKGFDFDGGAVKDHAAHKLLGIRYHNDAWNTAWFDSHLKDIQKQVDDALPDTVNTLQCGQCASATRFIVQAASDRQPTTYFVYDAGAKKLIHILDTRSDIKPEQMGTRDFDHYPARDGRSIPIYITTPAGKANGPRPAVVLVHGGPNVRGSSWEWEAEAQFLASRGYMVLQPEYRGSTGFGFDHYHAGWKQWGGAMQDDLADAVKWAVGKGWVDSKRVAIAGGSYGGYAALMGLVRNPEIFRCAIDWAGVTDTKLMFTYGASDASVEATHFSWITTLGDPDKDAESMKRNSPLANAAKITQPVLLAYGGADLRVPLVHGVEFRDAVSEHNKQVEWVEYPEEGHGWFFEKNRYDFWSRVDAFLARNLAVQH